MDVLAYFIAILIGVLLGLIGGGGSILTVPVLVYLLHTEPLLATTYSLFIVGFTSLIGGAKAYQKKLIDFRAVSLFGIPSILAIFIARHFLLPHIPAVISKWGETVITRGMLLMTLFAILMLAAALSMITKKAEPIAPKTAVDHDEQTLSLIFPGLLIGTVTGLLGAGGGFLIIPTLVLLLRMPMKTAVGTSLLIIAINSLFGFVFSIAQYKLDWSLLLPFTALAVLGVFIGGRFSEKIPGDLLGKLFGWFVLIMGVYIIVKEYARF